MEDSDTKKLYEVTELQEYQDGDDEFKEPNKQSPNTAGTTTARQHLLTRLFPLFFLVIIALLILLVILQAANMYIASRTPESASNTATSGAVTGGCNCQDCSDNSEILSLVKQLVSSSQDIMTFNNMQWPYIQNITNDLESNLEITQESAGRLANMIATLAHLKDNSISTEVVVNDIVALIDALIKIQNSSFTQNPMSCQDIKNTDPNSTSGYYHINSQIVYCEMGELCGSEGGWTRLGKLDMSDSTVDCPVGFKLYTNGGIRSCGRTENKASCESIKLETNGIVYSEVCGRVLGYQYASTDGVHIGRGIDDFYVDGVSITQGYPREHVWTYIAGLSDTIVYSSEVSCPCNLNVDYQLQSFIGNDYYCESGNHGYWSYVFYNDPLWDGFNCGIQEGDCCSASGQPWFHKAFNSTSTEYIEVRICGDQPPIDEDVLVNLYEMYVK